MVLAVVIAVAFNIFSRKAPEMLVQAIEKSLGKKILIHSIDYHFPGIFELEGFGIWELHDFPGESSFTVDKIRLDVSLLSLSRKKLIINTIEAENANITIRKYHGKLTHALSDAVKQNITTNAAQESQPSSQPNGLGLPLEIHQFKLSQGHFKYIDYDIQDGGFVIAFDEIEAVIDNIGLPFSDAKTFYKVSAYMSQGREQRGAQIKISGRTQFKTMDADTNITAQGVYLPYFQPYYQQVTLAAIESAYLDSRANLFLEHNDLTLNADLEISELFFRAYESENQLFGLRADEILSFLKDRSGRLKLQITAQWNIADRHLNARDIIRKSIERSLKKTVIGNVGNILENALQKTDDQGIKNNKDKLEDQIKKLKELFKY